MAQAKRMLMMPADEVRRLRTIEERVREAIGGDEMELAFRMREYSDFDAGMYAGIKIITERVLKALPKELPF